MTLHRRSIRAVNAEAAEKAEARHRPATGGQGEALWGVLKYRGDHHRPYYWEARFLDGTVNTHLTSTSLKNSQWLWPTHTVPGDVLVPLMEIWARETWPPNAEQRGGAGERPEPAIHIEQPRAATPPRTRQAASFTAVQANV